MDALAAEADLHLNTVRNAERGNPPNVVSLMRIAAALETTVGELLGERPAAAEEALPGWSRLPPDHQRVLRELVSGYTAAPQVIINEDAIEDGELPVTMAEIRAVVEDIRHADPSLGPRLDELLAELSPRRRPEGARAPAASPRRPLRRPG